MATSTRNQFEPNYAVPPGATLAEWLEENPMPQAELAVRMGRPTKTISEIIHGKTAITTETAQQLELVTGIPASFWNNAECLYRERLARLVEDERLATYAEWVKQQPVAELRRRGVLSATRDLMQLARELLAFYAVTSPAAWQEQYFNPQVAARASLAHERDPAACAAWLRLGERQAGTIATAPYDAAGFRQVLHEIRGFTLQPPADFLPRLTALCARVGAVLVIVPKLTGAPVYGITRWLASDRALIQLSLRDRWEDQFWFTFYHEAAHLLLHGKTEIFIEGIGGAVAAKEREADDWAADFLIPRRDWRPFSAYGRTLSRQVIVEFAQAQGLCPAIVVGRLQHEGRLRRTTHNGLRRRFALDDAGTLRVCEDHGP